MAVLLLGVAHVTGATGSPAFEAFADRHGRSYRPGSKEYEERQAIFLQRTAEVEHYNSRTERLWTAGINPLSDHTDAELATLRGWRGGATQGRGKGSIRRHGLFLDQHSRVHALPDEFNKWTSLKSLNNIRNQGSCGSCWAVTGTTVLSAHSEIYGDGRNFSTQELLSCVANPDSCGGNGGCDGATIELAFHWAMLRGLSTESEVPYKAITGTCSLSTAVLDAPSKENTSQAIAAPGVHLVQTYGLGTRIGMQGWERLPENRYEPLMRALVERGPVGVSVAASKWYSYDNGIFDLCPKDAVIDHAVTLIAYGRDAKLDAKFWLIQNSWGPEWGEGGRIRLLRRDDDDTEQCGTDSQPEIGTGCKGGPSQVRVCGMCGILYDASVPYFGDLKASSTTPPSV